MTDCTADCSNCLEVAAEQPYGVEIFTADKVFIKQMAVPKAGTLVPQHAHKYDHTSLLAVGSVIVSADGISQKHHAPYGIFIKAGVKHSFMTLEDNTIIYCIHSLHRGGHVAISEEHQIVDKL